MNTEIPDTARAGSTATDITEAQIIAFLNSKAAELARQTGAKMARIELEAWAPDSNFAPIDGPWRAYAGGKYHRGQTADDAIAQCVAAASPEGKAKELRTLAAQLNAEADALLAQPKLAAAA